VPEGGIWFGLACLKANPNAKNFRRFGEGKGAYVNVVGWAESKSSFEQKVKRHAEGMDCILVELEKVNLWNRGWSPQIFLTNSSPCERRRIDNLPIRCLARFTFGIGKIQTETTGGSIAVKGASF
jgi:hypothetical protein